MADEVYPINIWVNEERFAKLAAANMGAVAQDALAGLKVIKVPVPASLKDQVLAKYPTAKCDTATTKTIELLPREVKDKIFALVVEKRSVDVIADLLKQA